MEKHTANGRQSSSIIKTRNEMEYKMKAEMLSA